MAQTILAIVIGFGAVAAFWSGVAYVFLKVMKWSDTL
jgi:hypothetical protein